VSNVILKSLFKPKELTSHQLTNQNHQKPETGKPEENILKGNARDVPGQAE
jgi:hypothetical protein